MDGHRAALFVALLLAGIVGLGPGATVGEAAVGGANPCPQQATYEWMGNSVAETIDIPSLFPTTPGESYAGTVLRPVDTIAFPGQRPVVVLQHGLGGDQCALWWTAQDLAGRGYVAVVWTVPTEAVFQELQSRCGWPCAASRPMERSIDATRSAIAFVRSAANPFWAQSDPNRIAIGGFSMGAIVASYVQGDQDPGVITVFGFDNLVRFVVGTESSAACGSDVGVLEVTPRVPALSFNRDELKSQGCAEPKTRQRAFRHWRSYGIPSMELVMTDYEHGDFGKDGSETQRRDLSYVLGAWLDHWMRADPSAEARLLSTTIRGRPTTSLLATRYHSGAYLPSSVDTDDYVAWLLSRP